MNVNRCYIDGGVCTCQAWDVASSCPKDDFEHDDSDYDKEDLSGYDGFGVDPEHEYEARMTSSQIGELDDCHVRL